mgnify:FL=1
MAIFGILNTFVRLILLHNAPASVRTSALDIGIGSIGASFIIAFIVIPLIRDLLRRTRDGGFSNLE